MDIGIMIACVVVCVLNIWDLRQHNETVVETFPDENNQKHREMRSSLSVSMISHYVLLVLLVIFLIKGIVEGLL